MTRTTLALLISGLVAMSACDLATEPGKPTVYVLHSYEGSDLPVRIIDDRGETKDLWVEFLYVYHDRTFLLERGLMAPGVHPSDAPGETISLRGRLQYRQERVVFYFDNSAISDWDGTLTESEVRVDSNSGISRVFLRGLEN